MGINLTPFGEAISVKLFDPICDPIPLRHIGKNAGCIWWGEVAVVSGSSEKARHLVTINGFLGLFFFILTSFLRNSPGGEPPPLSNAPEQAKSE